MRPGALTGAALAAAIALTAVAEATSASPPSTAERPALGAWAYASPPIGDAWRAGALKAQCGQCSLEPSQGKAVRDTEVQGDADGRLKLQALFLVGDVLDCLGSTPDELEKRRNIG